MRLSADGVAISSGIRGLRIQACGLVAATWLKRDQIDPMRAACSSSVHPLAARSAFSKSG